MACVDFFLPMSPTGLGLITDYVLSHATFLEQHENYLALESTTCHGLPLVQITKNSDEYLASFLPDKQLVNGPLEKELKGSLCSICWDFFCHGHWVRKLKCGHYFHQSCIDQWLGDNLDTLGCPYCRQTSYELNRDQIRRK